MRRARVVFPAVLVAVIAIGVVAQILNANVFSNLDDAHRYGAFDIPGTKVVRLPAGSVELLLSNSLSHLRIPPHMAVAMSLANGDGPNPSVRRDVGQQFGISRRYLPDIEYRRVWTADIPQAGRYRVTVTGVPAGEAYRLNLGHGPPVGSVTIWIVTGIAAGAVLAAWLAWALFRRARAAGV